MNVYEGAIREQIIELAEENKKFKIWEKNLLWILTNPDLINEVYCTKKEMDKDYFAVTLYIKKDKAKELLSKEVYDYYEERGRKEETLLGRV